MKQSRITFPFTPHDPAMEAEQEERQLALEYLADAWNSASEDGIDAGALAHAALFAAIATMVRDYGEDATARLIEKLPERIERGEYTIDRTLQ